jgi:hypothetical protein
MTPSLKDQEWYSIAEQASKEMDPAKLTLLVSQLCAALDKCTGAQSVKALSDAKASSAPCSVVVSSPARRAQSA